MTRLSQRRVARGFTLTELAIVLVIVALLTSGLLMPLSAQQDQRNYGDTQKQMAEITEALLGFAASHIAADGKPYLPCPDTDDDGSENRTGSACTSQEGRLPWNDLGTGRSDAWNNRFRYRVTLAFANKATGFTLVATGNLKVCGSASAGCTGNIADNLPAVIVSHGKNGAGAFNSAGGTNPAPTGSDEIANQDVTNTFILHEHSDAGGNEFDDLVTWISPHILFNRMIAAGRLP